jgi:DNA polymerase-3 subunit gamma/tau
VVDAFAAADGAAVFEVIDRVIETGQDPRRFAEDLLRRLRDLVIVAAVPDAPATGLIDVSVDQGERLVAQSARFGGAELSRAADIVAAGLTEMRGATAPRLLLELICARVLLPAADHGTDGLMARIDRLEKRAAISGGTPSQAATSPAPPPPQEHPVEPVAEASAPPVPRPDPTPVAAEVPTQEQPTPAEPPPTPKPEPAAASPSTEAPEGGLTLVEVRRLWPDIVEATKLRRRVAWMHLTQNSQVIGVEGNTLVLGFNNAGARDSFVNGGCDEILRQAAIDVVGADWKIDAIVDPGARPTPASPSPTAPATPPSPEPAPSKADAPAENAAAAAARGAISQTRSGEPSEDPRARADADAHPDDPDADGGDLDTTELLQRELGAQVIEETPNK